MGLPDLSNSMYVAKLRHIQSIHEPGELRNPDTLVRQFLPVFQRWRATWLGQEQLSRLRADPFYYYLLARTSYYDQVLSDSVAEGVRQVVCVGCGSDTRAYRFERVLREHGVAVLECDLPRLIRAKRRIARRYWRVDHVEYLPLNLHDAAWPELAGWLQRGAGAKTLVLIEGVSPYIDENAFQQFLRFLARGLPVGSQVAYDFKLCGINDEFGQGGRTQKPFRLHRSREKVASFHEPEGLQLDHMELSSELGVRLLPRLRETAAPMFFEDGLVRLRVRHEPAPGAVAVNGEASARSTAPVAHARSPGG